MNIKIDGNVAVPMVITETTVHRPRKVKHRRMFRGIRLGVTRLFVGLGTWALDRLEDAFFEDTIEVLDAGKQTEQHFAIIVGSDGYDHVLQAVPVEHRPPCIHHYEIIRYAEEKRENRRLLVEDRVPHEDAQLFRNNIDPKMRERLGSE